MAEFVCADIPQTGRFRATASDWAVTAAPEDRTAHAARMKIYAARAAESRSTMSHGIFRAAAVEAAEKAGVAAPDDERKM